jgi:hypothetical protein
VKDNEARIMTAEEASALQREVILNSGNPDYVMPDGRKNSDIWAGRAERDEEDRAAAVEFDRRSLEANTPKIEQVRVAVTPEGGIATSPVAVKPAETSVVIEVEGAPKGIGGASENSQPRPSGELPR